MNSVILVVNVKVKEPFVQEVYAFMKALHKLTHELDNGCIQYDLHQVKDQENHFCFIETWESQKLLDEHMQKDHFKNFVECTEGKIEDMQISFLEKYEEEQ